MRTNSRILIATGATAIALLTLTACGPTAVDDNPSDVPPGVEQPSTPQDQSPDVQTPDAPQDEATNPALPGETETPVP